MRKRGTEAPRPPVLQSPFARSSVHYRQREDEQDEENSASGSESKKNLIRGKGLDPHVCLAWLREAPSENNLGCWKFRSRCLKCENARPRSRVPIFAPLIHISTATDQQ